MLPLLFLICVTAISSNAHHDPRCNPAEGVQVCVDSELDQNNRLNLVCVESRGERPLPTDVQWHKNGALHMDSTRIHRQRERLIFEEVLVSDEGNWTCSNGSLSPQFTLYAGKVNFSPELPSISHSIGDNFSIPCNIELGASTAQTDYTLNIYRRIVYNDSDTLLILLQYRNNINQSILSVESTAIDPTSYIFYSRDLTLYIENFSVPSPQNVRGVKFICEFSVINQGEAISATTTTAVIPGFHPPEIRGSLSINNVTVIHQGSNHTFMVEVYSHPPSRNHWWRLNDREISSSDSRFVMEGPLIAGNTSTFNLTIRNTSEQHNGLLQFTARLGNSTISTQTLIIIPPRVETVELSNSCGDIEQGDGPLNFNTTISSVLPALDQHHQLLQAELQVNFSHIPRIPDTEDRGNASTTIDISDIINSQGTGGKSILLRVNRAAVPEQIKNRIKSGDRFRAQVKLVLNGVTAAEWSPVCQSPIFQSCINTVTSAEIKLKLKFSSNDQCSLYSAREVKAAIEDLLRQKFSCDNIMVQSADEYHCHQQSKVSILKANVSTYFAEQRVQKFYSYLDMGNISIFDGSVEVLMNDEGTPSPETRSDDNMIYVFVFIVVTVLLFFVIVAFIVVTALMVKKSKKKSPKDPEDKVGDNRPPSSASSSRSQNFYVEDRSLSRSPMSPTSISSSTIVHTPSHTYNNHTPHDIRTPPHSPHSTHAPQDHNSRCPQEPVPQANTYHQVINLEEDNSTAIPLHCVQMYLSNQDPRVTSTEACETTMTTFLSEQEIRNHQQSRAESSGFGDDMSLNDSEHRLRFNDSPAMRSTPSSGCQSRQSSSLSRHHQKAPRKRHNTEGHPVTALVQLPTTAGGGYLVLHGLDLADRQRTNSVSQLQPATLLPASNVIQVQPAVSMSLADMQQRTCEMASPRSREHLRLPLPGAMRTSKELRTVVPCEVMSPHRRLSDPSPLSGSPREVCNLGGRGEEFTRQNTSGAESNSSAESIN